MTLKAGYTHTTVNLGLSERKLSTSVSTEVTSVSIEIGEGHDTVSVSAHVKQVECRATIDRWLFAFGVSRSKRRGDIEVYAIDCFPEWQIKPTMSVMAEIDAASRIKYGKPKMSIHACRYHHMIKMRDASNEQKSSSQQGSLF